MRRTRQYGSSNCMYERGGGFVLLFKGYLEKRPSKNAIGATFTALRATPAHRPSGKLHPLTHYGTLDELAPPRKGWLFDREGRSLSIHGKRRLATLRRRAEVRKIDPPPGSFGSLVMSLRAYVRLADVGLDRVDFLRRVRERISADIGE